MTRPPFQAFVQRVAVPIGAARLGRSGLYRGDVLYFAAGRGAGLAGPDAWRAHVAGELRITTLDTTHAGMTGPEAVAAIAPALQARLHDAGKARRNTA
jgi:enterobactin synthetase component F